MKFTLLLKRHWGSLHVTGSHAKLDGFNFARLVLLFSTCELLSGTWKSPDLFCFHLAEWSDFNS